LVTEAPHQIQASFYSRPTLEVLRDLIGKVLVHETRGRATSGVIVEAEAYIGESDPACHAAAGRTARTEPLYGPPGRAYVYFNYGLHYLVNAVTEAEGCPAAVLIRALQPLEGIETMRRRRNQARKGSGLFRPPARPDPVDRRLGVIPTEDLCRGPANLTVALGITLRQNRRDLTSSELRIEDRGIRPPSLAWSRRVGIRVGVSRRWRCAWRGHPSVSGSRG
jgi:DNA-3-methyladenine glycosylase